LKNESNISGYHVKELNELGLALKKESIVYQKAGDGLLLIGIKNKSKTYATRLKFKLPKNLFKDLDIHALEIIDKDLGENRAIVGSLDPTFIVGSTPIFWWPIDLELIRKYFFGEVAIATVYNPCHLINKLKKEDFKVFTKDKRNFRLEKRINDKIMKIEDLNYYFSSIQNHLLSEKAVIEIFKIVSKKIELGEFPVQSRIDIHTIHNLI
jgi:hypothetical protein